jgi:hypothetical protein
MRNLMTVEEAKGVCKDHSKWKEVISAYPKGNRRDVLYVFMYVYPHHSRFIFKEIVYTSQIFLRDIHETFI